MSTLKRSRRREFTLTPSFTKVIKSKITTVSRSRRGSKSSLGDNRSIVADTSNVHFSFRSICPIYPIHIIHYLPPEVLAHIFVIGASQDDEASIIFPVVVSHVCGAWRDLALATQRLWRRISPDSRLNMWKQYIHRSAACLLDVSLSRPQVLDVNTVQWYMHLVAPHIRRWRSFTVEFHHYAPFLWNAALSSCCGTSASVQAQNLEELTLIYPENDDTKEFVLFGGLAPRLKKFTLVGLRLDWSPSLFRNLTYLDYTHHGFTRGHEAVEEILSMLQVSDRLRELKISFLPLNRRDDYVYLLPNLTLPYLHRLHFEVRHDVPAEISILVGCLNMPVLRSLHLHDMSRSKRVFPSLKAFSKSLRRPPSLVMLELEYGWWEKRFFATFTSIVSLAVNGTVRWTRY